MRQLTAKQKKFLDRIVAQNPEITSVEDLENDQWQTLEEMNDTEVLYQNVNRYLSDLYFKNLNKK